MSTQSWEGVIIGEVESAWRSYPNNFIYSGTYLNNDSAETSGREDSGHYWSDRPVSYQHGVVVQLKFNNHSYIDTAVGSSVAESRFNGVPVRCVAGS